MTLLYQSPRQRFLQSRNGTCGKARFLAFRRQQCSEPRLYDRTQGNIQSGNGSIGVPGTVQQLQGRRRGYS